MIYDCFCFFNEMDILEMRLNILDKYVDKFVLVESTRTQKNTPKILYFQENKERYSKFLHKIIHIVVDDFSENQKMWTNENNQRNAIVRGLKDAKDDDIIWISDLDEIPDAEKLLKYKDLPGIKSCNFRMFMYYLNNFAFSFKWYLGTRMLNFRDLKTILDEEDIQNTAIDFDVNHGTTCSKIRHYNGSKRTVIKDAGWHFTWMGGGSKAIQKHNSVCEGVSDINKEDAEKQLKRKFFAEFPLIPVKMGKFLPQYIIDNQDKYSHLIIHDVKLSYTFVMLFYGIKHKITKSLLSLAACFVPIKKYRHKLRKWV